MPSTPNFYQLGGGVLLLKPSVAGSTRERGRAREAGGISERKRKRERERGRGREGGGEEGKERERERGR